MTVEELKEQLKNMPDNAEVFFYSVGYCGYYHVEEVKQEHHEHWTDNQGNCVLLSSKD